MNSLNLSTFPKSDQNAWLEAAGKQLKGKDPMEELQWSSLGLTELKPYYDETDISDLEDQVNFFQNLSHHRWKLYQTVQLTDEAAANSEGLEALVGGCDGIIFAGSKAELDYNMLLKDIDTSICHISTLDQDSEANAMHPGNCLKTEMTEGPAAQISEILQNISNDHEWIHRQTFADFFVEIASVRALRYLLVQDKGLNSIRVHSSVQVHESDEHQWFLNTTAGLAAILGGSHSIDLHTAIGEPRISRNVGNLIREESGIEEYTDQCGGSYLVESLTHQIIQEVRNGLS